MANITFTWELGGGLGHAARILPFAEEMRRRMHHCELVLRDLVHTRSLLKSSGFPCYQAPVWLHKTMNLPEAKVSMAEILMGLGYFEAELLDGLVRGWLNIFALLKPDVVIADYSPTALLAAKIAGIPAANIGLGFFIPPDIAPMPAFRDWEPIAPNRVEEVEKHVLSVVNQVLQTHASPPFVQLSHLFSANQRLLCTWPELDQYANRVLASNEQYYGPNFSSDIGGEAQWPEVATPKVFAYLKTAHPDHHLVLDALVALGCSVICYIPELASGRKPPLVSSNIVYSEKPLNLEQVCEQCDVLICHAGEGTIAPALLKGVPVLLLPMQAEQFLMARNVSRTGAGINAAEAVRPANYQVMIHRLLTEVGFKNAATGIAEKYATFSHQQQLHDLAKTIEDLLNP